MVICMALVHVDQVIGLSVPDRRTHVFDLSWAIRTAKSKDYYTSALPL